MRGLQFCDARHRPGSGPIPIIRASPHDAGVRLKNWLMALSLLALAVPASAQDPAQQEFPTRSELYRIEYVLNEDGSHTESRRQEVRVLKESALAWVKQTSVGYSTSVQKAEIVEAYTRKPDGRRVDVPKDNYQLDVSGGRGKGAPAISDRSSLAVIFPEVAVGDVLVLHYRIVQLEPIFPGHFSAMETFAKNYPYDDVRVRVDAPLSLALRTDAREMVERSRSEEGGRRVVEWSASNPKPAASKRKDWSVYEPEREPGVTLSTFSSHADIARAYGARAEPKAAVTERVRALAEEITKGRAGRREQARALYDWVATNITYVGNCVGVGAVVPRDLPFVLDNRMGDCKDHSTLLQALLAARGIKSTQALVNAGSSYRLPKLPVVSMVNHVITYIPEFDLYLDSTSTSTPFGMLPFACADKPVLLVDGSKDNARTPAIAAGVNRQAVKSVLRIQPDGSVKGDMEVSQHGMFAATSREGFRNSTPEQEVELVKTAFKSAGQPGIGKLEKDDPRELLDTYRYKVSFEMKEFMRVPGAGAFAIYPPFYSVAPVHGALATAEAELEDVPITCSNGVSSEEYVYHFPKGMKILAVPENVSISNAVLTYKATYALKGSTLTVKRMIDDRTRGNVCGPEVMNEFRKVALKALQNVKSQVVYK